MKNSIYFLGFLLICAATQAATVTVGPWVPIFKGIELASGQQQPQTTGETYQQVLCLRVDLTDPDIELFTTPKCTNCNNLEVLSENTSHFLEQYDLQVAVNGGFYASFSGPGDVALGTPEDVYGLAISRGVVVSPANNATYAAALLFTTNNQARIVPTNSPPTNTAGMYTAISGNHALLLNGVNLRPATPTDLDPRTALGLSQDRRYLFLMTIDGRQGTREGVNPPWSDGADFHDTGEWLLRFGASDGINVDGGGSTTMTTADCQGAAVRLNRSSFVYVYGRERVIGHNFGVHAKPLPSDLKDLSVEPGTTTALVTWRTEVEATNYGSATPLDSRLVKLHVATLTGLTPGSNYFFRAVSTAGWERYEQACRLTTSTSLLTEQLFGLTQSWTYTTNNLDGVNWKSTSYDDSHWLGSGPGLLYVEDNPSVGPKGTALPPPFVPGQTIPRTYYFRTYFNFTGGTAGTSLLFSNYVDDGAVFYLNGTEIYRLRMPAAPTAITYATAATNRPCAGTMQAGDALPTCPDLFPLSGSSLTNLVDGDNLLAVEVHNYSTPTDIVFGSALIQISPLLTSPWLNLWREGDWVTLFWNGEGFTLQQSANLGSGESWSDAPGSATQSPFIITNATTMFYRLRN
jgi:hypothetical protein